MTSEMRKTLWMSSQNKENESIVLANSPGAIVLKKVFFIAYHLWKDSDVGNNLYLESFVHPSKGKPVLFITNDDYDLMEILEFAEPYRGWFLKDEICSDGSAYMTTSFDVNFLALYHLSQHCRNRFMSMSEIHDSDAGIARLMRYFIKSEYLKCLSDVKVVNDEHFYKYNHEKTLCWLSLKTRRIADCLRYQGVHCGHSALSRNFIKSEKFCEEIADYSDYLRMAYDYIGNYLANDLYEELGKHLDIHSEMKAALNKRKSASCLHTSKDKKQKLSNGTAVDTLQQQVDRNYDIELSESVSDRTHSEQKATISCHKERNLSAKEKSLARSAKGTQNISRFFSKKIN